MTKTDSTDFTAQVWNEMRIEAHATASLALAANDCDLTPDDMEVLDLGISAGINAAVNVLVRLGIVENVAASDSDAAE